jgi:isoaspartyl peptidase/L-asparaginase-like protein (Ntn-hydrolase superfamily)
MEPIDRRGFLFAAGAAAATLASAPPVSAQTRGNGVVLRLEAWLRWKNAPSRETFWLDERNHDTIGMLGVDGRGNVVAGCSTSGLAWKIPGRVADSPLVGCGYYADAAAGAASATGNGDVMANYCTSVFIARRMAQGAHPQEACDEPMRLLAKTAPNLRDDMYCVIAIDPRGEIGAASMNSKQPLHPAFRG